LVWSGLLGIFHGWTLFSVIINIIDIIIVAYVIYCLLLLIRGTRAVQLIKGFFILLVAAFVSKWLGLETIQWILNQIWAVIFVALAVIFQPELRRILEQLGRGQLFSFNNVFFINDSNKDALIDSLVGATVACAKTATGMIVAVERETGLKDYIESGIQLDAVVSQDFLINIFTPNTPLHDGATIIRGERIAAAACFLPLSDNPYISTSLGSRHRAAIGLSEVSDAIIIVVSEENGVISVARNGKLVRNLDEKGLREVLEDSFIIKDNSSARFWQRRAVK